MCLLFVIDNLGSGGAQRQMVNLALGLQRRGHQIEFFVYYPQYNFYEPMLENVGITIHKWQKKNRVDPKIVIGLRRQIRHGHYNIVLSFLDTPNLYCELACLGMKRPILVVSERISYPISGPSLSKRLLEQFHRLADAIVVNSSYQEQQMVQYHPWMNGKLCLIYNGIDLGLYRLSKDVIKKQETFLAVGSVIPRKNVVGVVRALVEYKTHYGEAPNIDWAGAIYNSLSSQNEYKETTAILMRNGLEGNWKWLGERKDLHVLYPMYSALIHASFREGLANAVLEAMACGLPVLLSDIGEHSRLVKDGRHGKLFDPNSPSDLAQAMYELLNLSEEEQKQMGITARIFAESQFSMETFVMRYESLFFSLKERA